MQTRWERAQRAEKEHPSHQSISAGMKWAENWLDENFNLPLQYLEDKRILEIGCGTGMIHTFDFNTVNVGIDPLLIDFSDKVKDSAANLVQGAAEHLPFSDSNFDVVICYNVIDHVIDPAKLLNEARRVLTNGGDFLLEVNIFRAHSILRKMADHLDHPHPYHFTKSRVETLITNAGFFIVRDNVEEVTSENLKTYIALSFFGLEQYHIRAST